MSWCKYRPLILILLLALAGCGFRPLYSKSSDVETVPQMAAIKIDPARDRLGLTIRNQLIVGLGQGAEPVVPLYTLSLTTSETPSSVLVTRQESITRYSLNVVTSYTLRDSETGSVLDQGSVTSISAYNVLRSEFSNLVAEEDARMRAGRDAAEQIRSRIALYFRRQTETDR